MTELRFDGRVVIVTGAGRGIGRSHALLLAAKGARVVVADYGVGIDGGGSTPEPAEDVVKEIKASVEQFQKMLGVHFFGSLFVSRAAWPHFVKAGYGRIVNTVSEAMLGGIPELTSYGSAKGAVFGLTRNLATEGSAHGIRVNALAPRAYTRMSASHAEALSEFFAMPQDVMDEINAAMPPELCAPAAAFLSHESCPLNGEVLLVGMGGVSRLAVLRSAGIFKSELTAEDIAENLDRVLDLTDAQLTESTGSVL